MNKKESYVSILGDSISTFEGFNPPGYAVYYDEQAQKANGIRNVYDTWWAKVNQAMHAYLVVNNSYSGSKVAGHGFPSAFCERRTANLRTPDYAPDYILIYMGTNDFGYGVPITSETPGERTTTRCIPERSRFFESAYDMMLEGVARFNPTSTIICGTIMRTVTVDDDDWLFPEDFAGVRLDDYNAVIKESAARNGCLTADIGALGMRYETLDGTHPTAAGHATLADAWIRYLAELGIITTP